MTQSQIDALNAMLARGQDNALLRFGLGQALLNNGQPADAIPHLQAALTHDPNYSAAYKLLGKALLTNGDTPAARDVYQRGIAVAQGKGDLQAAKEMQVFLKRLLRDVPAP